MKTGMKMRKTTSRKEEEQLERGSGKYGFGRYPEHGRWDGEDLDLKRGPGKYGYGRYRKYSSNELLSFLY